MHGNRVTHNRQRVHVNHDFPAARVYVLALHRRLSIAHISALPWTFACRSPTAQFSRTGDVQRQPMRRVRWRSLQRSRLKNDVRYGGVAFQTVAGSQRRARGEVVASCAHASSLTVDVVGLVLSQPIGCGGCREEARILGCITLCAESCALSQFCSHPRSSPRFSVVPPAVVRALLISTRATSNATSPGCPRFRRSGRQP